MLRYGSLGARTWADRQPGLLCFLEVHMTPIDPKRKRVRSKDLASLAPFNLSRRQMLQYGAGGAALLLGSDKLLAQTLRLVARSKSPASRTFGGGTVDPTLRAVLNRATFGFSSAAYDEAIVMGVDDYIDWQLEPDLIDDSATEARLAIYDTLTMSAQEIFDSYQMMQNVPVLQLMEAVVVRTVYSRRQLHERMVEFWTDHFNIDITDGFEPFFKTVDDRDVIRQHAMGTFPELLNASARSSGMLWYLDNYANIVGHAQENYARELMELHTLGVNGPYTQRDVEEVARCLTGWTILAEPNFGGFVFHAPFHDVGAKTVLGQTIPAGGGESDGQTVLDILAAHPSTARFIANKMCIHFLGYDPPEDIVESVKQTYLDTDGDIKSMLRVILRAPVVQYLATPKFKRPLHLTASLLRAADAEVANPLLVVVHLLVMGHGSFLWPRPDGYPDTIEDWGSSLLPRWQFASALFDGGIPDVTVNATALLASQSPAPGEEAGAINYILTGGMLSLAEEAELQQFIDGGTPTTDWFGLAASVPGFQFY